MLEYVDDVPDPPGALLDLAGQSDAGHGRDVEGQANQRLGVIEALEQDAAGRHRHLEGEVGGCSSHEKNRGGKGVSGCNKKGATRADKAVADRAAHGLMSVVLCLQRLNSKIKVK